MSLVYRIASFAREKVDEVLDAHLELLSVVICTIVWSVCYGWIEANAIGPFQALYFDKYGHTPWWLNLVWLNHLGFYQLIFFIMSSTITFSFCLLKVHRMWRHKKRYFTFTALGAFPFSWMIEDISYFVFVSPKLDHLCAESWTNWAFGGFTAGRLWIPTWWILTVILSFSLFFLAYRSALYNLLLEREVERKLATQPEQPEPAREELAPEPVPAIQEPAPPLIEPSQPTQPAPTEPETQEEIRRRLLVKKALENA
ncbi:hypothetical protein MUP05_07850 [Candidatus Bathyarchaeota archaeon]|nr:hypothetical protein [Candidatus Bathyarchaeota archaeon]